MGKHNSDQYKNYIVGQFGGTKKERLNRMLERLMSLQKEEITKPEVINKLKAQTKVSENKFRSVRKDHVLDNQNINSYLHSVDQNFNHKFKANTYQQSLELVMQSTMSEYSKSLAIGKLAKIFKGWHKFADIPTEIFHTFFDTVIEKDSLAITNEECDCFKIVEFEEIEPPAI